MALSRRIAETVVQGNIPVERLVEVLARYGLVSLLPAIRTEMEKYARAAGNRETIHIESPFPLSEKALGRIKRIAGNDLAQAEVTLNETLLAGFKARYKGMLYDGSAERIIKQFTKLQ